MWSRINEGGHLVYWKIRLWTVQQTLDHFLAHHRDTLIITLNRLLLCSPTCPERGAWWRKNDIRGSTLYGYIPDTIDACPSASPLRYPLLVIYARCKAVAASSQCLNAQSRTESAVIFLVLQSGTGGGEFTMSVQRGRGCFDCQGIGTGC